MTTDESSNYGNVVPTVIKIMGKPDLKNYI